MPWVVVPLDKKNFGYFDRQRDLFSDMLHMFDDSWRDMALEDSQQRFEDELERARGSMHRMDAQPIMLDMSHVPQPFIVDNEGKHKFSLRFDCSQFKPEEIEVKTLDNKLKVHAKHVEESEGRKIHQEFSREYSLPDNVDPKKLESHLSQDGVLQIEAEVPAPPEPEPPKEVLIPIQHLESEKKSKEVAKDDKKDDKEGAKDDKKGDEAGATAK